MFLFPLINFTFLIILYKVHRKIFWITSFIEIVLYWTGIVWIYDNFDNKANQMLYVFTLTGVGFIFVFLAFFIAIFLNHRSR